MDIRVAKDCYVPKEHVKYYVSYNYNSVKVTIRKMKSEDKVYDFTGGKKVLTVIFLDSGEAILTSTSIETLHSRMDSEVGTI